MRPTPVWISSKISSRPCSSQRLRSSRRKAFGTGRMPPSPWIGSIRIAAVSGPIAAFRASRSLEGHLVEAFDLGAEALQVLRLAAGRDGGQGPAVEGALERDDAEALGVAVRGMVLAGHLDGRLVGLGAGIGEEHHVREGVLDQALGQPLALRDPEEVRGVPELGGLLGQGLDQMRMGVAEGVHGDAGAEIEISLAISADEPRPLPSSRRKRRRAHRSAATAMSRSSPP